MWIALESPQQTRFAKIEDRLTVGSSVSNGIVLHEKGVRPLHGQWLQESGRWHFKTFHDSVLSSESIRVGPYEVKIFEEVELWSSFQKQILDSFRKILKNSESLNFEKTILKLKEEIFCNRELPALVLNFLSLQFQEFSLLSPVERLLRDEAVSDVLVEDFNSIWVEKRGELEKSEAAFTSEENYRIYLENLLGQFHKAIDESHPFVDFTMSNGCRGHIIGPPLTPRIPYLSIRKPNESFLSLQKLSEFEMFSQNVFELLKRSIMERRNILISGAAGSGKTTLLKALMAEISSRERLVVLEDTPELELKRENTAYLRTRADARAQMPVVSLRDLVKQSLRMRPDRIVIGEVRSAEALDLLHAMNTGHRGCLGSLHANSARDALGRLEGLIQLSEHSLAEMATRDLIARNIHLVIHLERSPRRRIQEVGIVRGIDQDRILMETIL